MKIYSERLPIKYLFSDQGVCFGLDTKRGSYLFLITKSGVLLRKRPVGDTVVEDLDYEITEIHRAILAQTYNDESSRDRITVKK